MPLLLFGTHKRTFIAFVFIALAITGFTVAKLPPAQQPAPPNNMLPKTHQELVLNHTVVPLEEPKEPKGDIYVVTAYNLSVQSCGKPIGHPQYGITASGYSLAGHTWYTAKTIAVDTELIPLGSKVLIKFLDEKFKEYNARQ